VQGITTQLIRLFLSETNQIICRHLVQESSPPEEIGFIPLGEILDIKETLGGYRLDCKKVESINPAIKFVSIIKGRSQCLVCSGCVKTLSE